MLYIIRKLILLSLLDNIKNENNIFECYLNRKTKITLILNEIELYKAENSRIENEIIIGDIIDINDKLKTIENLNFNKTSDFYYTESQSGITKSNYGKNEILAYKTDYYPGVSYLGDKS